MDYEIVRVIILLAVLALVLVLDIGLLAALSWLIVQFSKI